MWNVILFQGKPTSFQHTVDYRHTERIEFAQLFQETNDL